jgi:hypothetical protein
MKLATINHPLMKIILFICLVYMSSENLFSQIKILTEIEIDFTDPDSNLTIDTTLNYNIWEIGQPNKLLFDSAFSNPFAICTDLNSNYPASNISTFQIMVVSELFGSGILKFVHKYETDPGNSGGYIERSYDQGRTWSNLVLDENMQENFYTVSDLIDDNIPAFSGSSNGWQKVTCYFSWYMLLKKSNPWPDGWGLGMNGDQDTLLVRFNFKSNELAAEKQGWLIDDIKIQIRDVGGFTDQYYQNDYSCFFQPESQNIIVHSHNQPEMDYSVLIFDITGRQRMLIPNSPKIINTPSLENGLYIIRIENVDDEINTYKILIYCR